MKNLLIFFTLIVLTFSVKAQGQPPAIYNATYVKALYAKYPIKKHNLCANCYIWVNPYYTSIADVQKHMPICTKEILTKANAALADKLNIPRQAPKKDAPVKPGQMPYQSAFSAWSTVTGQPNEDNVYTAANKIVKAKDPKDEIAKGHCNAWILNSFAVDAVILSDTYTFNAACEDQGQNVGTEIATENYTRKLLATQDVTEWVGTFGSETTFTDGKITDTEPACYWKILKFGTTTLIYWLPNLKTESVAMLAKPGHLITYQQLVANLGFDPEKVLP